MTRSRSCRGPSSGAFPLAFSLSFSSLAFVSGFALADASAPALPPVTITASRFPEATAFAPVGATVVTAEQIRDAGIDNVSEAIRKLGGVYGRQNLSGTSDYSLDLRGFGSSSDQNLVILLDGVRLSENELTPALLSGIPIDEVERIEIVRGGSSVLYGDGATGGVIQIFTKRGRAPEGRGTAVLEAGSYARRALRLSAIKSWGDLTADASASGARTDGFRDNNAERQRNFSTGLAWSTGEGRIGLRVDSARQDTRFPGALTLAQFDADPRQASTPNDFGSYDVDRSTLSGERHLGALDLVADLSHREKTAKAFFASAFGDFDSRYDGRMTQFSPRLRHTASLGAADNQLVAGIDLSRWSRDTDSDFAGAPSSRADATQTARAVYLRDEVRIGPARIAAGARHETFRKRSVDPVPFTTATYDTSQSLNAWELQGTYAVLPRAEVFAKTGLSYRVANVDENGLTPQANQPLAPQRSHDLEVGAALGDALRKVTVTWFSHRLTNEILYDPLVFANVNLDPTRRRGVEIEASARLSSQWNAFATFQHVDARFTDGPNAGREVTLVPANNATLRLNWAPGDGQHADVGVQWADSQRYGGDFDNSCNLRIPSYTTLDARYARRFGAWDLGIGGTNLADRRYFTNAFGACGSGIYPDSGRQVSVTARVDF
ncbi:MAG: TonB-dependent receptor family protein [Burkholderiaceae bacterium]